MLEILSTPEVVPAAVLPRLSRARFRAVRAALELEEEGIAAAEPGMLRPSVVTAKPKTPEAETRGW